MFLSETVEKWPIKGCWSLTSKLECWKLVCCVESFLQNGFGLSFALKARLDSHLSPWSRNCGECIFAETAPKTVPDPTWAAGVRFFTLLPVIGASSDRHAVFSPWCSPLAFDISERSVNTSWRNFVLPHHLQNTLSSMLKRRHISIPSCISSLPLSPSLCPLLYYLFSVPLHFQKTLHTSGCPCLCQPLFFLSSFTPFLPSPAVPVFVHVQLLSHSHYRLLSFSPFPSSVCAPCCPPPHLPHQ